MILLKKVSLQQIKELVKDNGDVILKDNALRPDDIKELREEDVKVSHQYCDELGEIGYKAFK